VLGSCASLTGNDRKVGKRAKYGLSELLTLSDTLGANYIHTFDIRTQLVDCSTARNVNSLILSNKSP